MQGVAGSRHQGPSSSGAAGAAPRMEGSPAITGPGTRYAAEPCQVPPSHKPASEDSAKQRSPPSPSDQGPETPRSGRPSGPVPQPGDSGGSQTPTVSNHDQATDVPEPAQHLQGTSNRSAEADGGRGPASISAFPAPRSLPPEGRPPLAIDLHPNFGSVLEEDPGCSLKCR